MLKDGEGPSRLTRVSPFFLEATEVSNAQFRYFVEHTGFVTESERFGWSFAFEGAIAEHIKKDITQSVAAAPWWLPVNGADWRHPFGPDRNITTLKAWDHPVVQVQQHAQGNPRHITLLMFN